MRPLLLEQQGETEQRGYHSEEIHRAFLDAGFYRTIQPRRFGGYEFDLETFYKLVVEVSRGCPSTGWCMCLTSAHAMHVASLFTEAAQAQLFGPEGDFRAPSRALPLGTAARVDAGYRITGTWDYCSGAPYATHFLPVALYPDAPAGQVLAVIPRSDWTMLDDWGDMVLGLRGSGSNSIVVDDAFVPEQHVSQQWLIDVNVDDGTVGYRLHGNPMYAGRTLGFFHGELVSIIIGAARAALDEYGHIITTRQTMLPPFMLRYQHPDFQRSFGLALGMIDAAEAALMRVAQMYLEHCRRGVEEGPPFSREDDQQLFAICQTAGRWAADAIELLFRTGGSSAAKNGQRLQRYYRDVSMYRGHFAAQYEGSSQRLGMEHFGIEPAR